VTLEELAAASSVLRDTLLKGEAKFFIADLMDGEGSVDVATVIRLAEQKAKDHHEDDSEPDNEDTNTATAPVTSETPTK
jgi:hypothetical protein